MAKGAGALRLVVLYEKHVRVSDLSVTRVRRYGYAAQTSYILHQDYNTVFGAGPRSQATRYSIYAIRLFILGNLGNTCCSQFDSPKPPLPTHYDTAYGLTWRLPRCGTSPQNGQGWPL